MQTKDKIVGMGEAGRDFAAGPLLLCVTALLKHYGNDKPMSVVSHGVAAAAGRLAHPVAVELLERQGFFAEWRHGRINAIIPELFPVILELKGGDYCIVFSAPDGDELDVYLPTQATQPIRRKRAEVEAQAVGLYLLCKPDTRPAFERMPGGDAVADDATEGHWLFGTLRQFKGFYAQAILASLLANILAIAASFYSMNIYDRVIPHRGYSTLLALTVGVLLALLFEHGLKHLRVHVLEQTARRADFILSRKVFRHLQMFRLENLPGSPGSLANVLREYESVREILTSATLTGLADLPFAFLFVAMVAWIGGWLAIVPIVVMVVMAVYLIAAQRPLARHANEQFSAASSRHGLLIETIEGLETVKSVRGEGLLLTRWDRFNELIGAHGLANRTIQSNLGSFIGAMQQGSNVLLMCFGAYLASEGYITSGVLVAAAILNGRIMAPISQVGGLALRYQQAKKAFETLDDFMRAPTDCEDAANKVVMSRTGGGAYEVKAVDFAYPGTDAKALNRIKLSIPAGAHLGLLGEIGSGKSTLLRILAGLYEPQSGMVTLDGVDLQQVHPASLRERVGVLSQEPRLFSGSLRDNLLMGARVPDKWFIEVTVNTGVHAIAAAHPHGYNMRIGDKGSSLSGGQKQLIAWARMLLAAPDIVLMDEPTGAMDPATEQKFIRVMGEYLKGRTMVLITHRVALLELADRVAIIREGVVEREGDKSVVLRPVPVAPVAPAASGPQTQTTVAATQANVAAGGQV